MRFSPPIAPFLVAVAVIGASPAALAAQPDIAGEFQSICVANRLDSSKVISTAMSHGYSLLKGPTRPTQGSTTMLTRMIDGRKWVVRLELKMIPASGDVPEANSTVCSIGGYETGTAGGDAVRRWARVTPLDPDPANTTYVFTESAGRHLPLQSMGDPEVKKALDRGGLYILTVKVKGGMTVMTLLRNVPAASN
ncbi:MAG: hypothetical protein KF842_10355 [Caulobacter sp.]|nr:hypothetical protein [Caulobacter sp.]